MANVLSMVGVKNHPSRSGFDLSRKNLFTAKVGEILPVAVVECLPGDKTVVKTKWMTRTQPLNTAAYTRIKEYYNWYFVPTNLLWNRFNDFVMSMKDNNLKADSIDSSTKLSDQHPYVTLSQIWSYIHVMYQQGRSNFFGYDRAKLTCKLLEYLGYGDFYDALTQGEFPSDRVDAVVNLFPLLAYQKIYQDHIRDSQWEKAYAPACNINYMKGSSNSLNIPLHDIDMDLENMFDLRYSNWGKDYFMGVLPNSQYGPASAVIPSNYVPSNLNLNLFTSAFGSTTDSIVGVDLSTNKLGIRSSAGGSFVGGDIYTDLTTVQNLYKSLGLDKGFSILQLRQAEAVQKMREVMQAHQQDYKSQLEARWNVVSQDAYSDRCKWLGGDSANIDINEVVNTNLLQDTTGLPQTTAYDANIKGKGVGVGDGYVRCNTECHGYLVCLYHSVPVLDFSINGVKKHNLKTLVTDYAQPELDRTGMVSLPVVELINKNIPSILKNGLIGYVPQYYEYKIAYDECHGGFYIKNNSFNSLNSWVSPIGEDYIKSYADAIVATGTNQFMSYYFLKVPPAVLDPIFAINANEDVSSDQLLVNSYFDIKSARNLDYNGLPY